MLLAVVLLPIAACSSAVPQSQPTAAPTPVQDPDIRGIKWGFSLKQVVEAEGRKPDEIVGNCIAYLTSEVNGLDAALAYYFNEDSECYSVAYVITETHTNENLFIDDYRGLKSALAQKYGNPINDQQLWSDDLFKKDREDYGLAVSIGHLSYLTSFETDRTNIKMSMNGDNYDIIFTLRYTSKDVAAPAKQASKSI